LPAKLAIMLCRTDGVNFMCQLTYWSKDLLEYFMEEAT